MRDVRVCPFPFFLAPKQGRKGQREPSRDELRGRRLPKKETECRCFAELGNEEVDNKKQKGSLPTQNAWHVFYWSLTIIGAFNAIARDDAVLKTRDGDPYIGIRRREQTLLLDYLPTSSRLRSVAQPAGEVCRNIQTKKLETFCSPVVAEKKLLIFPTPCDETTSTSFLSSQIRSSVHRLQ